MAKKFTLKPIEKKLIQIRAALEEARETATRAKKRVLTTEIRKLNKLIHQVRASCKHYDIVGG